MLFLYFKGFLRNLFNSKISCLSLITPSSHISTKVKVNRFAKIYNSSVHEFTYVGVGTEIINTQIGKFCSIANNCRIGLASHTVDYLSTSPIFTEKNNGVGISWIKHSVFRQNFNIKIGNDVWIGYGVIILGNVTIGDGAIIGAGAIVTKDVPPYAIVVGCPAKIVRYRFSAEIIQKLQRIEWWNWSEEKLKQNISLFQSDKFLLDLLKIDKEKLCQYSTTKSY